MKSIYLIKRLGVVLGIVLMMAACGGSDDDDDGGGSTGATLTGDVVSFTASLNVEKKTFLALFKEFLFPYATAQVSGVTVTVGDHSTTTGADGSFTLNDIDVGDQTVTFTEGGNSATYALNGVDTEETFTLNDVTIEGTTVSTALTGTWTGQIELDDGVFYTMTMTINANGNSLSGTLIVEEEDESGTFSGTENGSVLEDATYEVTSLDGCVLSGPLTGTFSGTTLTGNAPVTADTCGLQPGDQDPDGHPFTLTKN